MVSFPITQTDYNRLMTTSSGIHHITAITGDPQKNIDFYEGFLGQKLIKRTVNFDDPRSYHFYFGDCYGKPGTLLTFFYWKNIPVGTRGVGEVSRIMYGISTKAKDFWMQRAKKFHISCISDENEFGEEVLTLTDPDGMTIELVVTKEKSTVDWWKLGDVLEESALRGFYGATLTVMNTEEMVSTLATLGYTKEKTVGEHTRFVNPGERAKRLDLFEAPEMPRARQGSGSVHHIAFRSATDSDELDLRGRIQEVGAQPTPVIDRQYFHSVYFMTPAGVLFEIATDGPGFGIDEPLGALGEKLVLPPQYEPHRAAIVAALVPVVLPRNRHGKKN